MFTGLVEEVGSVAALDRVGDSMRMTFNGPIVSTDAVLGASIAVNGVCLTVTDLGGHGDDSFSVDVMAESLQRSNLGLLAVGDRVNLERALAASARFGGHIVQGHVDGVGVLRLRTEHTAWHSLVFDVPADLDRYIVEKGSITVSGVSLTVTGVSDVRAEQPWFSVGVIPTTLDVTTLGSLASGDQVNLEVDVLAKYVERIHASSGQDNA